MHNACDPLRGNPTECAVHTPWIPTLRHWHSLADCACNTYADAVATVSAAALQLQPPCTCAYASLAVAGKYNLLPPTPGTFPQPQMETFVPESNIHTKQGPALGVEARPVATHRSRAPSTTGCATWSNCPCNKACTYLLCCHSIVRNLGDLPAGGNPKQSHRSETPPRARQGKVHGATLQSSLHHNTDTFLRWLGVCMVYAAEPQSQLGCRGPACWKSAAAATS